MGERDNHIATRRRPQPRGRLLTHGHGEQEVDGEVQPGEETAATAAATALGGGSPWPPFFLGDGAGMEVVLYPKAAAWEEEIS